MPPLGHRVPVPTVCDVALESSARPWLCGGGDLQTRLVVTPAEFFRWLPAHSLSLSGTGLEEQGTVAPTASAVGGCGNLRFLTDAMCGRLTRWLRCAGLDTEQLARHDLTELVARAKATHRTVITCSSKYAAKLRSVPHFLLSGKDVRAQFVELAQHFELTLDPDSFLSRCTKCNGTFVAVPDIGSLQCRLPPRVLGRVTAFWECCLCKLVVWKGSQFRRVTALFEDLYGTHDAATQAAHASMLLEVTWEDGEEDRELGEEMMLGEEAGATAESWKPGLGAEGDRAMGARGPGADEE
jgi:uncharacterized protein with PIN domain